jgi:hypothetical protein
VESRLRDTSLATPEVTLTCQEPITKGERELAGCRIFDIIPVIGDKDMFDIFRLPNAQVQSEWDINIDDRAVFEVVFEQMDRRIGPHRRSSFQKPMNRRQKRNLFIFITCGHESLFLPKIPKSHFYIFNKT